MLEEEITQSTPDSQELHQEAENVSPQITLDDLKAGKVHISEINREERLRLAREERAALQDEALVAIAAFDIAAFIDFKPDARVAERCGDTIAAAIAGDAAGADEHGLGCLSHARALAKPDTPRNGRVYW
jgi:hypothetical protein